jgi:nucleoside-diphosphate-sugar epimerase
MNILVTGGSGGVGRGVVARLKNSGHNVRVVDVHSGQDRQAGVEYVECDITRFDDLLEQVRGMEGIVHLAAYAYPAAAPGHEIFRVNCWGTYNVYEAAAAEGIKRVACASSINALGFNYGVKHFPIEYFPIDEDHPTFTTDPYSFSKQTLESIAAYYWRRDGIASTCLRMPFVYSHDQGRSWAEDMLGTYKRVMTELLSASPEKQRDWMGKILVGVAEARRGRLNEKPWVPDESSKPDPVFFAGFGYTDFWAIIAVEDAAQAFEKSLLADFEGSHPLLSLSVRT